MKIIVAGGRDFYNYSLLKEKLNYFLSTIKNVTIISGTAKGADSLGERYATEKKLPIIKKPADWDKYGKAAGYKRNEEMAVIADGLIAFWNGSSKGTKHMIDIAKKKGLAIRIVSY